MRIGLLGTLQVHDDEDQPVRVGGHRVRSLLILLALDAGRTVPVWSLVERLWPDDPPADAQNALQTLISRLRAALRTVVVIESQPAGYRLAVEPQAVDAFEFEELTRNGSAALAGGDPEQAGVVLRRALDLWRGPALADVADADFAVGTAARLEELRLTAVMDRIEADLALGEPTELVGELRSLVVASPLAERPRILLMRALQAQGRQADALAEYAQARELLADHLGVDPSPGLEAVYLSVLRQEGQPARPRTASVGTAARRTLASFVGREEDMRGVCAQLASHRLVTLTGPGGIGKTRLAGRVAEADGGGGIHLVELAKVTTGGDVPFAVLDAVAGRERSPKVRTPEVAPSDPLDRLAALLADRDALLILDNCEHVVDAAAIVADRILADCQRVRILATSREPLRITGEMLWPLAPLAENAAVRLLADRAAAVVPGFVVDEGNEQVVRRICRALDGMPLAIELAAAWLRVLTPAELAERLSDRFALLTGGSRSALPRHQTLRAVVDWSWESLSKPERILARRLAIFPAGVALEAAEGVCADATLRPEEILPTLSGLVDKSIVMPGQDGRGTGTRYRMLETIRAYAAQRLAEAGEEAGLRSRFTEYFLRLAETADPHLRGAQQLRWLRALDTELDNLHAAIRMVIDGGDGTSALRFMRSLGWFWMIRSDGEAEALAREALRMPADDTDQSITEARVICGLMAAGQAWDIDAVRPELNEAVRQLRTVNPALDDVHPLAAFGEPMLALQDRQPARALELFEDWARDAGPWDCAMLTLMRAQVSTMMGQYAAAERLATEAADALRALGDEWALVGALASIADLASIRGDHAAAFAALEEAARVSERLDSPVFKGHFEGKLAALAIRLGDLEAARERLHHAGELSQWDADTAYWLEFVRAELDWADGDLSGTIRRCETVLAELDGRTSVWWHSLRATVRARYGLALLRSGESGRARQVLSAALRSGVEAMEQPQLGGVLDAVAVLAASADQATAATLLGAATTLRGRFDESSLDSVPAREAARRALGDAAYEEAYRRGLGLSHDEAVALASSVCEGHVLRR